ncbi:DJ-1 family glyoxalase III [Candidatus Arthromitus sp. SFB-rat-Yit]|uniref:DJ-1 family glyoxalase III n=1 Tax=Candidatus Arthromitus sp. SFB-rat-Yit TaxID=1041504 RepID=UPI000227A39C|nr:DJ-1 family glyoxalase III [Candidatus Arthromitus sp. SFB-rat-Yit]BAK81497.1 ThiJ family intracellular protease [Candidatus Arthromitus sp. SFB-rat-Yit]
MKVCIFNANGFEELESIGIIDILRRGNVDVDIVSITDSLQVVGAHDIKIVCDKLFKDIDFSEYEMAIFPGGVKGVEEIRNFKPIFEFIEYMHSNNKYLAAICAAPVILGDAGLLEDNKFTCYEGFEQYVKNGTYVKEKVVINNRVITSNCAGSVFDFGFKLLSVLKGDNDSDEVKSKMILF